jgi:hypothetical protein
MGLIALLQPVLSADEGCIAGRLDLQINSESTTDMGIRISVTAAAAMSAVGENIVPSSFIRRKWWVLTALQPLPTTAAAPAALQ